MLPILVNFSFFKIKSLFVFVILAFFFSAFVFWKKGREEHYNQLEIFDLFLGSGLFGFLAGRFFFFLFHWSIFSENVWRFFNPIQFPGNEPLIALTVAAIAIYRRAIKKKWDAFEILDFWVTAISLGMVFMYLGFFLDGSYGGSFTNLPWGVITPGTFEKSHPVQLYFTLFYLVIYKYLLKIEYNYRTLDWYRQGRKTAQSGFLFTTFSIFVSAFYLLTSSLRLPSMLMGELIIDDYFYLLLFFIGVSTLLKRSGRNIFPFKKERKTFPINK